MIHPLLKKGWVMIIKCKECDKEMSDTAKACPHCGAEPPKTTSTFTWVIGGFMALVFAMYISNNQGLTEAQAQPTPEQAAATKKADGEWNAAVSALTSLKKAAKNPKSFELESFVFFPGGSACYEYRASNSFNAIVPGRAVFDAGTRRVLTSENDGNKFVATYNQICTKTGGVERAGGIKLLNVV